MRITKVTTKTGDQGDTALGDGSRVSKDNARIQCLGSIDELNASIGLALVTSTEDHVADLESIQNDLLNIGGELSIPLVEKPLLHDERVSFLEKRIELINKELPPLEEFIIPGGSETSARLHVARSICRRAERNLVSLKNTEKLSIDILKYINRLSDYLFVLARLVIDISGSKETQWDRRALLLLFVGLFATITLKFIG